MQSVTPGSIGLFISIFLFLLIAENSTSGSSSVKKDGSAAAVVGGEKIKKPCVPCHLVAGSIKAMRSLMSELELVSETHCSTPHNQEIKDDNEETRGARAFLPMRLNPHQMYYHQQLMHHPVGMSNKINYGQQQNGYIMPRVPVRHQQRFVNYNFPRQATIQSPAFNDHHQPKLIQPGPAQVPIILPQLSSSLSPTTTPSTNIINNSYDSITARNIIQETTTDVDNYDKSKQKSKKKKKMCSRKKNKKRTKLSNQKQANRVGDISSGDYDDEDDDYYSNDQVKSYETTTAANYHESILPLNRGNLTNYKTDDISTPRV